jgi:hypothetical protein
MKSDFLSQVKEKLAVDTDANVYNPAGYPPIKRPLSRDKARPLFKNFIPVINFKLSIT